MTAQVVIVSPIRLFRDGLAEVLERTGRVVVLARGSCAGEVVDQARRLHPDAVLVDTARDDGLAAVETLATAAPAASIVALGAPDREAHLLRYAEAGAVGFVSYDGSLDEVLAAIDSAVRNEAVVSPHMTMALIRRLRTLARAQEPDDDVAHLTSRELEIVDLIDRGLSNKEIARELSIEVATVKNHVHNILEKLHVRRRSEAAARVRFRRRHLLADARLDLV